MKDGGQGMRVLLGPQFTIRHTVVNELDMKWEAYSSILETFAITLLLKIRERGSLPPPHHVVSPADGKCTSMWNACFCSLAQRVCRCRAPRAHAASKGAGERCVHGVQPDWWKDGVSKIRLQGPIPAYSHPHSFGRGRYRHAACRHSAARIISTGMILSPLHLSFSRVPSHEC